MKICDFCGQAATRTILIRFLIPTIAPGGEDAEAVKPEDYAVSRLYEGDTCPGCTERLRADLLPESVDAILRRFVNMKTEKQ